MAPVNRNGYRTKKTHTHYLFIFQFCCEKSKQYQMKLCLSNTSFLVDYCKNGFVGVLFMSRRECSEKNYVRQKTRKYGKNRYKKWEKKWNEMKLEKVKIEKQNESNGKSTRMSSKTLCLTASHANQKKKLCVICL